MNQVMAEAKKLYDIVIFDMPPVVAVTDAQIMASKADGTILLYEKMFPQGIINKKRKNY